MSGPNFLQRHGKCLTAIALIATAYGFSGTPQVPGPEREALGRRFRFDTAPLPSLPGVTFRTVRAVNPSLDHISAWISSVGAAVALHDLDGDGLPNDVVYVDPRTDQTIVCPAPGTPARYEPFALDPAPLPYDAATMAPMGALPGDFDEDGRADVLVYYWGRTPVAFLARAGSGALARGRYVPAEVCERPERWFTNAATQADLDGDGHTDLVFGNYFSEEERILDAHATTIDHMQRSMSRAMNGGRNRLLRWVAPAAPGGVRFVEADALPEPIARAWTLAVGAQDLDGDLLPEIYFANDFGPDRLLHNRSTPGQIRFERLEGTRGFTTAASKRLGRDSFKGMGVDFGDLNGDALPDIYVSNIAAEYALLESHFVWISTGETSRMRDGFAPYVDHSELLGLARSDWGWEARLEDLDNDGALEAMQATGFVRGEAGRWPELQELAIGNDTLLEHPWMWPRFRPGDDLSGHAHMPLFVRAASGRYVDVAADAGLGHTVVSRGIATADVDGDGDQDLAVANQWAESKFHLNRCPRPGAFLGLHLLLPPASAPAAFRVRSGHPGADTPGRPAIGAAALARLPDGRRLVAQVDGGNGHSGKRSPDLHFGLGGTPVGTKLAVDLAWRDATGAVRRRTLELTPGWHTVVLGAGDEVAAR